MARMKSQEPGLADQGANDPARSGGQGRRAPRLLKQARNVTRLRQYSTKEGESAQTLALRRTLPPPQAEYFTPHKFANGP